MTAIERNLLETLSSMETAIRNGAAAPPKPDMKSWLARLDALAGQLPPSTDPALLHYLRQRSYEKARRHLQSESERRVAARSPH